MNLSEVRYDTRGAVAVITLDHPQKRNVLSARMTADVITALETANGDDAIRAVVFTGAGPAFCGGGDIDQMLRGELKGWGMKRFLGEQLQRIPRLIEEMDKLLVAAVNGPAAGGGFDLALACDLRTAGDAAVFISSYVRLGLAPGMGGCFLLPRIVGLGRALDILMSGREVDPAEALNMGLVNRRFPGATLLDDTVAWIETILKWPQPSLKVIKRGVYQGLKSDLKSHLDYFSAQDSLLSLTEEHDRILDQYRKP